jgi:hypothetical protein
MKVSEDRLGRGFTCGLGIAGALLFAAVGCGTEGPDGNGTGADGTGTDRPGAAAPNTGSATEEVSAPLDEAAQDQAMGLRAKVEVPNQGVVKFFEPQAGIVLIAETGLNGTGPMVPVEMEKLPAVDLYEALSKQKAPTALVDAVSRAALLKQRALPTGIAQRTADLAPPALRAMPAVHAVPGTDLSKVSSALTFPNSYDQWFYDNFCAGGSKVGNPWTYAIQWMFVTGTGSFQRNDMNWVDSTVSVYGGGAVHYRVQIEPWYSWSTVWDVQIQNGYYSKWHRDNGTDYDVYIYVDQAPGDSYHLCSYGDSW